MLVNQSIIADIKAIISQSKDNAIRAVDHQRTFMYWYIGKRIFEEEQEGKDRADYGKYLTNYIADELEPEYGSGFSKRQIELIRQFYRTFPIANTLYSQLNWTQYKLLLSLDTDDQRTFYIAETIKNNWTVRQLERQIYTNLYERLLISNDKESVLALLLTKNSLSQPAFAKDTIAAGNKTIIIDKLPKATKNIYNYKEGLFVTYALADSSWLAVKIGGMAQTPSLQLDSATKHIHWEGTDIFFGQHGDSKSYYKEIVRDNVSVLYDKVTQENKEAFDSIIDNMAIMESSP